ncbi:DUF3747 domain-containing protein [Synechococcus sp. Cruz-9H2]|uniref:DUF3747 domain-containing protein n=1 Tax=unclassified Synechococcus TaxID=2626047 RepID=UPI0020CC9B2C|nr:MULTISPECIES: DUF3747 domain-containing protein [unclassified Synechococcus]MCP9819646.1 DUF3747 domain-containing protein [Synechococcus sp. Cruz-9H2]MCP9843951.1 DUF3747 domain-containing protein [Synechococcus sp. Edmonson 11F2]MCP9856076.1 DUF3747 domain-containing protein [Synechococcus sp. Cruz-9C9]MCP9863360.1 DUF3747 domain-containing protein [Synechococcus sp. Cruz-7E5]MCP9870613.1 DUF3747 domain-containing protein [Synechococcus sp. Cruz-7B9]
MRVAPLPLLLRSLSSLVPSLPVLLGLAAVGPVAAQGALFSARDLDQSKFVLVAAPIGDGVRAQLNIYEQVSDRRPCFSTSGSSPARVEPLLGSFDFTGICSRYMDANGYSLRVGGSDLATVYRLSVVRQGSDNILLAAPGRNQAGPEVVVARTQGHSDGFLQFVPEPGWKLMRRHYGNRALGHVYIYRDTWPGQETSLPEAQAPAFTTPSSQAPATIPPVVGASATNPPAPVAPGAPVTPVAPSPMPIPSIKAQP